MRNGHQDEGRMDLGQSPIHRAVWNEKLPLELFTAEAHPMLPQVQERLERSMDVVRRRARAGTLYDARNMVSDGALSELGEAGYWGLRVEPRHGGAGASFAMLTQAITQMVLADPWVAGLASTQAALGPVSVLEDVGTPEQKARLLPPLASGARLGAFAVTEPGASSDWSRMSTTARRDGDRLLVTGEKAFITNAAPGRTIALMCRLDGRLEMLVVELPWREDASFEIVEYSLRAPVHCLNAGLRFRDLPVPAANLLVPRSGDGRTIAYRAINHGRVAVCAVAAGMLRRIAGSVIPWVRQRETFGAPIGTRELVQRRLGRLAARIVACDALGAWAATLLDEGYRGELECIVAKVFASEALKEATVDILLKTHGGRAFLDGNLFADCVHDMLAPTIYEGENEVVTFGFFNRLAQAHGARYLSPITDAARAAGFERPDLRRARQIWAARQPLASYVAWLAGREARQLALPPRHGVPADAERLTALAGDLLHESALEISRALRHSGAGIGARQALTHELATRIQHAVVLLVVSQYAAHQDDPIVRRAGLCMAMELGHELLGTRPSVHYHRLLTELGAAVAEDRFAPVAGAERGEVAMPERLPAREEEEWSSEHPTMPTLLQ
ncbi:MAG TPA: acyl-CoA dehydrogenase family protein [Polyangiaceae bacterium]|nr:acyl-CoA dehydrogenase family protein [Polyangiaceae bacterium]